MQALLAARAYSPAVQPHSPHEHAQHDAGRECAGSWEEPAIHQHAAVADPIGCIHAAHAAAAQRHAGRRHIRWRAARCKRGAEHQADVFHVNLRPAFAVFQLVAHLVVMWWQGRSRDEADMHN